MQADLEIVGGTIVTPKESFEGVVYVTGGKIAAVTGERTASARQTIDARGLHVLPGVIDAHVHMMDPGFTDREDFLTGTAAAARGGITTIIEHHRHAPPTLNRKILRDKRAYLGKRSLIDFSLMGGAVPSNLDDITGMWEEGAVSFKGFTCEIHGQEPLLEGELYDLFRRLAQVGGMALVHCESDSLTRLNERQLRALDRTDPLLLTEWRSPLAELLAVRDVAYLATVTGARVAVAHVSQPAVAMEIQRAREAGAQIYAETCAQYLYITTEDLQRQGPFTKFTPPPRDPETVAGMWEMVEQGLIDIISSDHCPFPKEQKAAGLDNIWDAPFGIPGVETSLRLLLTGVAAGKLSLNRLVSLMCENPARLYGLYPRKGTLQPGSDADIVLVDLKAREVITNDQIISRAGWTPYEGREVVGVPVMTIVRGKIVMENNKVEEEIGWGQFIGRTEGSR